MQWWQDSLSFIASAQGVVQRACLQQDCGAYWLRITDPHFLSDGLIRVYMGLVWQQQQFVLIKLQMEFSSQYSYFKFLGFGQVYTLPVEKCNHYFLTCSNVVCICLFTTWMHSNFQSNSYFLLSRLVLSWWDLFWYLSMCYVFCWLSILSISTQREERWDLPMQLKCNLINSD